MEGPSQFFCKDEALRKLENNKDKKRKQAYVIMLKDAYDKVLTQDLAKNSQLKKDGNPELYKMIYESYVDLEARQNAIKRISPLYIDGKLIRLEYNDYSDDLVSYRYKTSDYLMDKGLDLLDSGTKPNARKAYSLFDYVNTINPNFEDVVSLMHEAHEAGINYVHVSITNNTHQLISQSHKVT